MRIDWRISKKRGNLRPLLTYSVSLAEQERELALPGVRITSTIPKPEEHWQEYCYPGQFERAEAGREKPEYHDLEVPSHRGRTWTQSLRLPWREDNTYPEVEASFLLLRKTFEAELSAANASQPLEVEQSLEISTATKMEVAPGLLAERFLTLARNRAKAS